MSLFALAALYAATLALQQPPPVTPPTTADAEQIRHAEDLLENGNYSEAEPVLATLAAAHPSDPHILFDLGFTQEHNGHDAAAQKSYQAAIAADASLPEPQVALGLLEARSGHAQEASRLLHSALAQRKLTPGLKARALRATARLDQAGDPARARDELAEAIQLSGQQPGDDDLAASLTATTTTPADAETLYRQALARDPNDIAALVELASLLQKQNKLADADALLTPALAVHPDDPRVVAQTAVLYAAEGKTKEALDLLTKLRDRDAGARSDANLSRLTAHLQLLSGDAPAAEAAYRTLAEANPGDPTLLDDLGSALVREQKFAEAQAVFNQAVAQRAAFHDDAAWGDAAGHLAFAASRNHQPQVVLQALQARATVLPNSPATMFLEATALDALHRRKEAERAYRTFLAAANDKLPDEEFEARHRLIALEHEH